ncbi:MAG: AbrB/MazE/SpoVT family DNA-binding domain-containing protein [Acidobacteria bacterium]|nr:AbrB/MazE/SpoVT family DNA-binding domain-containing protein [Acidobacteriota bacterium]
MKSTISSKGQIVLPVELRRQDGIQPGQTFEIERIEHGEYRLVLTEPPRNQGLVDALLACPEKDWLEPITRRAMSGSGRPSRPDAPARRSQPR